jgi:hypothetical protein
MQFKIFDPHIFLLLGTFSSGFYGTGLVLGAQRCRLFIHSVVVLEHDMHGMHIRILFSFFGLISSGFYGTGLLLGYYSYRIFPGQ